MFQRLRRWLSLADARDDMAAVRAQVAAARLEAEAVNANLEAVNTDLEMLISVVTDAGPMDAESIRRFREYLGRPEVQAELDEIIAATAEPL